MVKMTLSEDVIWRGLIKESTFKDVEWLDKPKKFYLGVDAGSADSLTVGNLAVFLLAKRFLKAGWETVLLVGGATSLIGDPGGKDKERELVKRETVEHNKAAIRAQVEHLFENEHFTLVDNYDWFKDIGYLEFLRDVGKHYSMTELVQRDYIKDRMGEDSGGISYAEFSYSLIQGYDYWHLFKSEGVVLQIGGSDQWGNMLSGVPLVRKKENQEVHAMSMPLVINKSTGQKFGKSEAGAVWLDAAKTSVYQFYQFWLNADDEGVEDYLKIFTELAKDDIDGVMSEFQANKGGRAAQKKLAYEVTKLVHGEERTDAVVRATDVLFSGSEMTEKEADVLKKEITTVSVKPEGLAATIVAAGLANSNSEAIRFLAADGIYINGEKATAASVFKKGSNVLKRGKNSFAIIEQD